MWMESPPPTVTKYKNKKYEFHKEFKRPSPSSEIFSKEDQEIEQEVGLPQVKLAGI
jgi:hypothetical protein